MKHSLKEFYSHYVGSKFQTCLKVFLKVFDFTQKGTCKKKKKTQPASFNALYKGLYSLAHNTIYSLATLKSLLEPAIYCRSYL